MKKNIQNIIASIITAIAPLSAISATTPAPSPSPTPAFRDTTLPVEQRITDLLARLTLDEKAFLCHGNNTNVAGDRFFGGGVARLGIPPIRFLDGRVGLRTFDHASRTALPGTLSLSCTWDRDASYDYGLVLADEMLATGAHVLFAPGPCVMRDPRGGRNFEYLGEDPYLCGAIAVDYIKALQDRRVAACSVLFVANDHEHFRHFSSSNLTQRTLREIYYRPFEMTIRDAGVWTIMTGNNLVNGTRIAASKPLLQDLLKDEARYDGVILTDWRSAYDTIPSALAGLDMTTGFCAYVFGEGNLARAVRDGSVPETLLDDKARRVLRLYARTGLLDPTPPVKPPLNLPAHALVSRRLATEGMVLLKNDRALLPLDLAKIKTLAITGPAAAYAAYGLGSGTVYSERMTTPLEGIKHLAQNAPNKPDVFHLAWRGTLPTPRERLARAKKITFPARPEIPPDTRRRLAAADAIIFFATDAPHGESNDLATLALPAAQDDAIRELAAINPNIIVVLQTGQPVLLAGIAPHAPAILAAWYAGQEAGDAIADILFGAVNPSGKLSCTFARDTKDYPCEALGLWPPKMLVDEKKLNAGTTAADRKDTHAVDANYGEGVFIGYRWFDKQAIEPLFPFGHGLSYTTFALSGFELLQNGSPRAPLRIACTIKNTGARPGAEVVQVYVAPPKNPAADAKLETARPIRELKAFARVPLQPGESKRVEIPLPPDALARFDESQNAWVTDSGDYTLEIGTSSRDIKASLPLRK